MGQAIISVLRSPHFAFLSCGVIFALLWHFSILHASSLSWLDNRHRIESLFLVYLAAHVLLLWLVSIRIHGRRTQKHRAFLLLLVFAYLICLAARALDWNVLYYYGGHIDALFWDNAFYQSGTGMLFTRVGLFSICAIVAIASAMAFLLTRMIRHQAAYQQSGRPMRSYMLTYCALTPLLVLLPGTAAIRTFVPADTGNAVYTEHPPEYHIALSLHDFLVQDDVEAVVLSDRQKAKLAAMGLQLETASAEYPLMKGSVYLNESHKPQQHAVQPNVIIVLFYRGSRHARAGDYTEPGRLRR